VVIAGRSTDTALTLAPMVHRFGWKPDDTTSSPREPSPATSSNAARSDRRQLPGGLADIPDMAEHRLSDRGSRTRRIVHGDQASRHRRPRHSDTVKEQLLYELGDPKNYITPDCVADFTSIQLEDDRAGSRARHRHSRRPRPAFAEAFDQLHEWMESHRHAGLQLAAGARKGARGRSHCAQRLHQLGLKFDEIYTEFFGVNACHGPVAPPNPDPPEVQLRIGVRGQDRKAVDRFTRELIPAGAERSAHGATGFGEGRPPVREIVAYWPALIPRDIAFDARHYPLLVREVTPGRVKQFFGEMVKGKVERYELPNLGALNFLLHETLGGGGTLSLRVDAQGKTLGAALLRMEIDAAEHEVS
jgi:hypothetical protein